MRICIFQQVISKSHDFELLQGDNLKYVRRHINNRRFECW